MKKKPYILTTEVSLLGNVREWLALLSKKHYPDAVLVADNILILVTEDDKREVVVNFFELHNDGNLKYFISEINIDFMADLSKDEQYAIEYLFSQLK